MVRYLIGRPVAVILAFIALIIGGIFSFQKIPVSLLPDIDVPEIVVRITYPNNSVATIEANVTSMIRDAMIGINNLEKLESESTNHSASIFLGFKHGTRMDLTYVNINEKIDRILTSLPKDLPRPQVIRINTSDVPIVRLQVIPKHAEDLSEISELTMKVIKKRLEQVPGISLVDVSGGQSEDISVVPDKEALRAAGLNEMDLAEAIQSSNAELGSLSINDGQYRFFVKVANRLENIEQINQIPVRLANGAIVHLWRFAKVSVEQQEPIGYHLFNGKESLVITVHKQSQARMNELMPKIREVVDSFERDYQGVDFALTQDQTFLLNSGIENLTQDLIYGGILCIALLFLFLGNVASPILMSISIPVSLLLTFIFFYLFRISFNIISLSGLALGIGMLIDNSIVVLDNITRQRKTGLSMDDSCVLGTNEVIVPVISQVLSTIIIYAPLIYLSGLAGAIIYDQAIALTISLVVSLLVAFCLNPLLYKLFLRTTPERLREDTRLFSWIAGRYHEMIHHIFKRKRSYFLITILFMPLGFFLLKIIPLSLLPHITETESVIKIDWNKSVSVDENKRRVLALSQAISRHVLEWESDVGLTTFFLQQDGNSIQNAGVYYKTASEEDKKKTDELVSKWLDKNYPSATYEVANAPNAFTKLFVDNQPYFEARFRPLTILSEDKIHENYRKLFSELPALPWEKNAAFKEEQTMEMRILHDKVSLYHIDHDHLVSTLEHLFGGYTFSSIKRFGEEKKIRLDVSEKDLDHKMNTRIAGIDSAFYPIKSLIDYSIVNNKKFITADKSGIYQSVYIPDNPDSDLQSLQRNINSVALKNGFSVTYTGKYYSSEKLTSELMVVFCTSIILLYVLLAIQFENLVHPVIVMCTIPFGIGGAMLILWIAGGSLDVMAAIGFVVVLGIIVDDPTLKVETINRLRKEYVASGMTDKREILRKAISEAGDICLKPVLMVSLTTSLALVPILFSGGIGNDLQRPLIYVIVGGLTIGTFLTLWFTPLAYWFLTKKD